MKKTIITLTCSFILIMTSFALFGQDDAEFITYKQTLMRSNGMHMGLIGQIMQKNLPFKNHVSTHATVIQKNNLLLAEAFEKKITAGKTKSKPEIWSNWANFTKAAKTSADAAAALANSSEDQMMANMRTLGGTCGGCHKDFRMPKS